MVIAANVQESPIPFPLKGLEPCLEFCCQEPALTGITEGDKMSVRISLSVEASDMFLSIVWAILESISGFKPSLEIVGPRYLKFSTASSL